MEMRIKWGYLGGCSLTHMLYDLYGFVSRGGLTINNEMAPLKWRKMMIILGIGGAPFQTKPYLKICGHSSHDGSPTNSHT